MTAEERAAAAEKNRAEMPLTAELVDATRAIFPECRIVWALEVNRMLGVKGPYGVPVSDERVQAQPNTKRRRAA